MNRFFWPVLAVVAVVAGCPRALACAACFGKSDSPLAYGMNAGIFVLLAVIGSMLGLIASFFVFVSRRSARIADLDPACGDTTGSPHGPDAIV